MSENSHKTSFTLNSFDLDLYTAIYEMLKSTHRCTFPAKAISIALTYITSNVFII